MSIEYSNIRSFKIYLIRFHLEYSFQPYYKQQVPSCSQMLVNYDARVHIHSTARYNPIHNCTAIFDSAQIAIAIAMLYV